MSRKSPVVLLLLCLLALSFVRISEACGPELQGRALYGEDDRLEQPYFSFTKEIARLTKEVSAQECLPLAGVDPSERTQTADLMDLRSVLDSQNTPTETVENLLAEYNVLRENLLKHGSSERLDQRWLPSEELATLSAMKVPDGIPAEFSIYTQGSVAFYQGDFGAAREYWQKVLDLPSKERKYRSTWAAYMIGRSHINSSSEEAGVWFKRTQDLVTEGYTDTLGLGIYANGMLALIDSHFGRFGDALDRYLQQAAAHCPGATTSLYSMADELFYSKDSELRNVAQNRTARRVITALLVRDDPYDSSSHEKERWCKILESISIDVAEDADRLAWIAYVAGKFDLANRWLKLADKNSTLTKWLQGKLLIRAGKMNEAASIISKIPADELHPSYNHSYPIIPELGDLGIVMTSLKRYDRALDYFMAGGFSPDAFYVAECILTPDELLAYVKRTPAAATTELSVSSDDLRYLLARRLARLNRFKEASEYYPKDVLPILDAYLDALSKTKNMQLTKAQRSKAYWTAARILRDRGMELLGTEVEPDWTCWGGLFEASSGYVKEPASWMVTPLKFRTKDEEQRYERHKVKPPYRFHYRWKAMDLAWSAAQLLPDNSDETAGVLCVGGSWIKNLDVDLADRFYKALVRRCGKTELGLLADKKRWFPDDEYEIEDPFPDVKFDFLKEGPYRDSVWDHRNEVQR